MKIEQIKPKHKWTTEEVEQINILLYQLTLSSDKKIDAAYLRKIAAGGILLVMRDGQRIIGMGGLAIIIAPAHQTGRIEDMVVHGDYRGQGLGRKIAKALIARARQLKLGRIDLTSHRHRVAANKLYLSLGFKLVGEGVVNFYTLHLNSVKPRK